MAVDGAGNLYAAWVADDGLPRLAVSRDDGLAWGPPMAVAHPAVTVVPPGYIAAVAGDEGKVAVAYVGSDVSGGLGAPDPAMQEATWHAYVGVVEDALAADPVVMTSTVNDPSDPVRRGPCLGFCHSDQDGPTDRPFAQEEYGMGDYLGAAVDPTTGKVWMAFVDVCVGECAGPGGSVDSPEGSVASVGVQVAGPWILRPG